MKEVFQVTQSILRSGEDVFMVLTTPALFPKFLRGITEIRSAKEILTAVGDSYAEARVVMGKTAWSDIVVTQISSPRLIAFEAKLKGVTATYVYEIEHQATASLVSLKAYTKAKGLFAQLLLPLVNSAIRKQDADQLVHLKASLEKDIIQ